MLSFVGFVALAWSPLVGAEAGAIRALTPEAIPFDRVAATELPALKVVLEKAGWPAGHVQALLSVEVQRRINPASVLKPEDLKPFSFWHTGPDALPLAHLDTPARKRERAEREEKASVAYDRLFPAAPKTEPDPLLRWEEERTWGAVPEEKRRLVKDILDKADRADYKFKNERGKVLTDAEKEAVRGSGRAIRRQLEAALGPEGLLDYDLRNSDTAAKMREELDTFAPSREEFLAIFRLRHPIELEYKGESGDSPLGLKRAAAEKEVTEKIAALLGPERFDDYQISLQPACQLLRFDGRFARIDAASVRRLYRVLLDAQSRIAKTASLPEAKRAQAQQSIKQELFREFGGSLDEKGVRLYLGEQGLWP